jgi:hypothetical protein
MGWIDNFLGRNTVLRCVAGSALMGSRVGLRRPEIATLKVGDLHQNRDSDALKAAKTLLVGSSALSLLDSGATD